MKLIDQEVHVMFFPADSLKIIESAGRTCYKSEDKITDESASRFVGMLKKSGHHSVLEHAYATVKFVTNRGVTHELVRHRLASYSQESTRYVNYGGKDDIEFIQPVWWNESDEHSRFIFKWSCKQAELFYKGLLKCGWKPEQAREVLPNALKTEIIMTANFREWMHIFKLRNHKAAHPQIRQLIGITQGLFAGQVPELFSKEDSNE